MRKDGTITLLDEAQQPALVWGWSRGLPVKWTGMTLNAAQSQVAIEQLEIAHEGLTLVQLSDLHIGPVIQERFVDQLVERANEAPPTDDGKGNW